MFAIPLGRWPGFRDVWSEADALETKYGAEGARRVVLQRIAKADRARRRRLYLLHDELARRTTVSVPV